MGGAFCCLIDSAAASRQLGREATGVRARARSRARLGRLDRLLSIGLRSQSTALLQWVARWIRAVCVSSRAPGADQQPTRLGRGCQQSWRSGSRGSGYGKDDGLRHITFVEHELERLGQRGTVTVAPDLIFWGGLGRVSTPSLRSALRGLDTPGALPLLGFYGATGRYDGLPGADAPI